MEFDEQRINAIVGQVLAEPGSGTCPAGGRPARRQRRPASSRTWIGRLPPPATRAPATHGDEPGAARGDHRGYAPDIVGPRRRVGRDGPPRDRHGPHRGQDEEEPACGDQDAWPGKFSNRGSSLATGGMTLLERAPYGVVARDYPQHQPHFVHHLATPLAWWPPAIRRCSTYTPGRSSAPRVPSACSTRPSWEPAGRQIS